MAGVVHVQHGLEAERVADERGGGADASAALEIDEIVHREPVAEMEAVVEHDLFAFLDRAALALFLHGHIKQQTEPTGRAERINAADVALGILFAQLLRGDAPGVVCAAQTRGKTDVEDILAVLQDRLKALHEGVRVHGARARDAALAHLVVELGEGELVVRVLARIAVEHVGQPGVRHAPLLQKLRRDVACGIGVDHKVVHGILSLYIQQIISIGRSRPREKTAPARRGRRASRSRARTSRS